MKTPFTNFFGVVWTGPDSKWREFFKPIARRRNAKPKQNANYFRYSSVSGSKKEQSFTYVWFLARKNRLADGLSFSDLVSDARALFALIDVILYLFTNGLKHPHCLPDVGIWSRVLERLQVDGDSLCLGDDLSVFVVFWKFVGPFGDLQHSFLAV